MASKKKLLQAAAGAAGGEVLDIDDVFSTYLYDGTGSAQVIENGIALGNSNDGGSARFDGTRALVVADNTDFQFGTGNWTVEAFIYPTKDANFVVCSWGESSSIRWDFGWQSNTNPRILVNNSDFASTAQASSTPISNYVGQWVHMACVRNGSTITLYVNGTSVTSMNYTGTADWPDPSTAGVNIGARFFTGQNNVNNSSFGYISDFRIVKGTAVYTSNFTPSTSALTAISGTSFLGLSGDTPLVDNSGNSHSISQNSYNSGNVVASEFGPFTGTSGEGGMIWIKGRNATSDHALVDTERGGSNSIASNTTAAQRTDGAYGVTFNSNGFTSTGGNLNVNGREQASWTWRKAPKWFDIVTYTGTGGSRTLNHNLGSTPGMIIVKDCSNAGENWTVYHRGIDVNGDNAPETDGIKLNTTAAAGDESGFWNDTAPTSTQFTVGGNLNTSFGGGATYVAYLFAHNDGDGEFGPDSDQDIIKCGSYTGNGSSTGPSINLGFEPQWLLIKAATQSGDNWFIVDSMRGLNVSGTSKHLYADDSAQEFSTDAIEPTSTGFKIVQSYGAWNTNNVTYIYMAIRRGPLAEPESATDVFAVATRDGTEPSFDSSFPVDFALTRTVNTADNWFAASRLNQGKYLQTNRTNAEASASSLQFDYMDGWNSNTGANSALYAWMWKRAPSYFDVATYNGNSQTSAITVNHNLGVVPEMMWCKKRGATGDWMVYHKDLNGGTNPHTYRLRLNSTGAEGLGSGVWNAAPTATQFSVGTDGDVNSGENFIVYLFASLAGVSKVGSYTGNGTNQNIDCGFSSGARFVLIKRTDSDTSGEWYIFDTERGIVAGNDSTIYLNFTDAQDTSLDIIDPYSSGFNVNNNSARVNINTASYIFYAIA